MPNDKVTDSFIERLVNDMTSGFGGEINIGPRGFLRTFVDILDKSQMYDNYRPQEQFEFNEEIRTMVETVENETAHIVNF
jgi:adenosylhomocysteinase